MYRKHLLAALVLTALCVMSSFGPTLASVGLVYFRAEPHSANTIMLTWETATESGTNGFRVHRSESPSPADWGEPIATVPAQGNAVTGAQYSHEDAVTPGVTYYYLLREVTSGGVTDVATASAGIGVATNTPTATGTTGTTGATATASRTPSATWTRPASSVGSNPTATPTTPAPTATQRYTNTPVISPLGTPTRQVATPVPLRTPTPTPLPPATVATPTGSAAVVTIPPTLTLAVGQPITLTPTQAPATLTSTREATATVVGPVETATPLPTKDVTPIIFAAETTPGSGSPTPTSSEQVAGQGSRGGTLALMIGGSVLGLAGLLAAVFLFLRSRKS